MSLCSVKSLMLLHSMNEDFYVIHWALTLQVYPLSERPGWPKETHTWLCTDNWTWLWKGDTNTQSYLHYNNEGTLTHKHSHINPKKQITKYYEHYSRNVKGICVWSHLQCSATWWQYLLPSSPGSQKPCSRVAHMHGCLSHKYQIKPFINLLNPY